MGLNISGLCSKTEQEPARKEQGVRRVAWPGKPTHLGPSTCP